ncbi:MAG: nuclear transport factor 2 family protein [Acidimicrobiales bacterium]
MTPDDLVEIEAIKQLKYRYIRAVDLRLWDVLEDCLTEDAVASYAGGKMSFEGRAAILGFMRDSLGDTDILTAHRVHQPEIALTGPKTATARWALDDTVIVRSAGLTIRGAAYYEDEMVKTGSEWRIASTGYKRIYEEMEPRDRPGLQLVDAWWDQSAATP